MLKMFQQDQVPQAEIERIQGPVALSGRKSDIYNNTCEASIKRTNLSYCPSYCELDAVALHPKQKRPISRKQIFACLSEMI